MNRLDLKIPPPAIALTCGLLMWLVARQAPALALEILGRTALCGILALAGLFCDFSGFFAFRRKQTTINPLRPHNTSIIVSHGIYRYTRNPMYVGLLMFLTAWAVWLSHLLAFALLPAFVAYLTRFQIIPEERILTMKFGETYTRYTQSVRRWI